MKRVKQIKKVEVFGDHDIEVELENGTKLIVLVRDNQLEVWTPTGKLSVKKATGDTHVCIRRV